MLSSSNSICAALTVLLLASCPVRISFFLSLGLSRFLFHSAFGLSVGAYLHNTFTSHATLSPRSAPRITHPAMHNDHFSSIQVNYTPLAISAPPPSPHRIAHGHPPFARSLIRPVTHSFIPHPTQPTGPRPGHPAQATQAPASALTPGQPSTDRQRRRASAPTQAI